LPLQDASAWSADFKFAKDGGQERPLVIKSNTLEIDNDKKVVTFTGNVDARKDDWIMNCNTMTLFYQGQSGGSDKENLRVDRIVAKGDVRISRPLGGEATAEEAVYYQAEEKVVLTGGPMVKQGEDFVEGSKITLLLKENRSIVEGSERNKVRAVIAPRSGQR
jgi:lipopolysaccharide export system protein LptA